MPSRSAPTATTVAPYAGSSQASSSAWRLVPPPDTSTTRRAGVDAAGTGRSLGGSGLRATGGPPRPERHRDPAEQAADAERGDGVHEGVERHRPDLAQPSGPDRATGQGGEETE